MSYLIVAAHPDDEVLGAGGTIHKLVSSGKDVYVCIMSGLAEARSMRPDTESLKSDIAHCMQTLNVKDILMGTFPNIEMNTVPHLRLVQFVEEAIIKFSADRIITHHPSDTNNDHMQTSLAVDAAVRLFQRRKGVQPLKALYYMEVPSSTDWAVNSSMGKFDPNTFVEIGEEGIEKKISALSEYDGVMRDYPHPRSVEALRGLAAVRGAQAGIMFAEAFECVFNTDI